MFPIMMRDAVLDVSANLTPELGTYVNQSYLDQQELILVTFSLVDRILIQVDHNVIRERLNTVLKHRAPITRRYGTFALSQHELRIDAEQQHATFITDALSVKANPTELYDYLRDVYNVLTERLIQCLDLGFGDVVNNDIFFPVMVFVPDAIDLRLFKEHVTDPAQAWLNFQYSNVCIVAVTAVEYVPSDSPH